MAYESYLLKEYHRIHMTYVLLALHMYCQRWTQIIFVGRNDSDGFHILGCKVNPKWTEA